MEYLCSDLPENVNDQAQVKVSLASATNIATLLAGPLWLAGTDFAAAVVLAGCTKGDQEETEVI